MRLVRVAVPVVCAALLVLPARPAAAGYASIVIDADNGKVLHEANAEKRNHPASLVKMMTLYLTFEALESGKLTLNTPLKVSRRASRQPSSKLALRANRTIKVEQAVLGLVTKSANDAATVLAEGLAGTEAKFAQKMTDKARALGMANTVFRNASGLPNRRQKTTARDMATLARALLTDFPQYYHYFGTRKFTYQGNTFANHNRLLKTYEGADGIKTGYVSASGFNLVASVQRNGWRLIGVVMGKRSARARDAHMARLLDAAFLGRTALQPALVRKPTVNADGTISPAVPARLAATAKAADAGRPWSVQVGAFSRFAPAHLAASRAARNAPRSLMRAKIAIVPVKEENGTIYRARLGGLTEERARKACETLNRNEIPCVAVPPEGDVSVALAGERDQDEP